MRTHLQYRDTCALVGDLTLLTQVLFDLIRHNDPKHRKGADGYRNDDEEENGNERLRNHSSKQREQINKESDIILFAKLFSPENDPDQIHHDQSNEGKDQNKIPSAADKLVVLRKIVNSIRKLRRNKQDKQRRAQAEFNVKNHALFGAFPTAKQNVSGQKGHQSGRQKGFDK